jgi:DNA-binding response OmpR family regulator
MQEAEYRLLYVGNDLGLLEFVCGALKDEGCFVVRCPDGGTARLLLGSGIHYHLLMFDEELPDVSGRELARFVRSLEHRERTSLILLSAKGGAAEARGAGARVFLQGPEPFHALVDAVRRLLGSRGST